MVPSGLCRTPAGGVLSEACATLLPFGQRPLVGSSDAGADDMATFLAVRGRV